LQSTALLPPALLHLRRAAELPIHSRHPPWDQSLLHASKLLWVKSAKELPLSRKVIRRGRSSYPRISWRQRLRLERLPSIVPARAICGTFYRITLWLVLDSLSTWKTWRMQ
jgi:hypothetical protein